MFYILGVAAVTFLFSTLEISGSLFAPVAMPRLVLALLIALTLLGERPAAYLVIATGGLLADIYSSFWPGMELALFLFIGIVLLMVNRRILQQPPLLVVAALAFVATLIHDSFIALMSGQMNIALLIPAFSTTIASLCIYLFFIRLIRKREVISLGEHF